MSNAASEYGRDKVIKLINSVLSKVEHAEDESRQSIAREIRELQKIIEDARAELGAMRPTDINDKHIPTATDELDAVVASTAEATNTIMDACDTIMEKAMAVGGENGDAINNEVTKVYEACSFQDITGQRITKVVTTLRTIEEKVNMLVGILSDKSDKGGEATAPVADERTGDAALLNGPQLPSHAISQEDIDKLLEDF
jgi:chemotaxis protein CheZ